MHGIIEKPSITFLFALNVTITVAKYDRNSYNRYSCELVKLKLQQMSLLFRQNWINDKNTPIVFFL